MSCLSIICPASYGEQAIARIGRRLPTSTDTKRRFEPYQRIKPSLLLVFFYIVIMGEDRAVKTNKVALRCYALKFMDCVGEFNM